MTKAEYAKSKATWQTVKGLFKAFGANFKQRMKRPGCRITVDHGGFRVFWAGPTEFGNRQGVVRLHLLLEERAGKMVPLGSETAGSPKVRIEVTEEPLPIQRAAHTPHGHRSFTAVVPLVDLLASIPVVVQAVTNKWPLPESAMRAVCWLPDSTAAAGTGLPEFSAAAL